MIKSKQIIHNKLLLVIFSCLLAAFLSPRVDSQAVNAKTSIIAQNFLKINYGSNYYSTMLEADRFYKQGDLQKAKQIQQQVKPSFLAPAAVPLAQDDLAQLNPQAKQYWDSVNQAIEDDPDDEEVNTLIFAPLQSLVKEYPQFVPGHILLADTYDLYGMEEEALNTIETASEMYPERDDVLDRKIDLLLNYGQPLEASIAAREFSYSYPDSPQASDYRKDADKYFKKYQKKLKSKVTTSSILGGIGQIATGKKEEGVNVGKLLLQGESATGAAFAESYKAQSSMVSNSTQLKYVRGIGNKLAKLMGRDEFDYEFYIINDPTPNAFALPGGKIFFHTGMLNLMDSEAELAGVMAHEIAHSVLSHGYKQIGESALTDTGRNLLSDYAGDKAGAAAGIGGNLLGKEFSRGKEKQADVLGLRVLNAASYSADGLYNVMAKLAQLEGKSNAVTSLLSSHPASEKRMRYLEELIQTKGYNRYGYEGVEAYRTVFPR